MNLFSKDNNSNSQTTTKVYYFGPLLLNLNFCLGCICMTAASHFINDLWMDNINHYITIIHFLVIQVWIFIKIKMKQWAARHSLFFLSFTARQKKVYINKQRITDNNENWTIHLKGKTFIVNKMLHAEYIDIYNCQYLLIESYALHYYYLAARSLFYIIFTIAKFSEICIDFCTHHCYFAGCLLIQSGNHLFVIASKKETHQYFLQSQFLDIRVIFSPLDFKGLLPFSL